MLVLCIAVDFGTSLFHGHGSDGACCLMRGLIVAFSGYLTGLLLILLDAAAHKCLVCSGLG